MTKGATKGGVKAARQERTPAATAVLEQDDDPRPSDHDRYPRCRVPGCGAELSGGSCPACAFRARKYAKLFEIQNPNCECGAPRQPKKPNATRMPKRCPLCSKLHARAKAKRIAV